MPPVADRKIVLVIRPTRIDELVSRFNTIQQARFYVEHLGADFSDYTAEHETYGAARQATELVLRDSGRVQVVDRGFLPNFIFGSDDVVVVLGQDGLVANTLKYLTGQAVVAVNPDPQRWDGVLLPFDVKDLWHLMPEVMAGHRPVKEVTMARVVLNDGQHLLAVNDLFVGPKTHISARYQINVGDKTETQSSSGVIISTGLGTTGWLKSLLAGAVGITGALSQKKISVRDNNATPWDAPYLYFTVREPFPSKTTSTALVFGKVEPGRPLTITSLMPEHGVIFSDGIEKDFLAFNSGTTAKITLAENKGRILV